MFSAIRVLARPLMRGVPRLRGEPIVTRVFTRDETWSGGYYELALEMGKRSDTRLLAALASVWAHPSVTGCYLKRDQEPNEQARVAVTQDALTVTQLQGTARMPNEITVACGTCLIREDDGPDWLVLYLPMGALSRAYDVGAYPFDSDRGDASHWRRPVDTWLRGVASDVYERARFELGLIGHEVSGELYARNVVETGVPERRWAGILLPDGAELRYYASTE